MTTFLVLAYMASFFFALAGYLFFPLYSKLIMIGYLVIPGLLCFIEVKRKQIPMRLFRPFFTKAHLKAIGSAMTLVIFSASISSLFFKPNLSNWKIGSADGLFTHAILCAAFIGLIALVFFLQFFLSLLQEIVWRGYLVHKLEGLGFWSASAVIAFLWWVWLVPPIFLFNHPHADNPLICSVVMLLFCLAATPHLLWISIDNYHVGVAATFIATLWTLHPTLTKLFPDAPSIFVGTGGAIMTVGLFAYDVWVALKLKQEEKRSALYVS